MTWLSIKIAKFFRELRFQQDGKGKKIVSLDEAKKQELKLIKGGKNATYSSDNQKKN